MRFALFCGVAATVFVASAPLGYDGAAAKPARVSTRSPVECSSDRDTGRSVGGGSRLMRLSKAVGGLQARVTPPANVAPPPPIPVPPVPMEAHADLMAAPPPPSAPMHGMTSGYTQADTTERYDGKAVSNVLRVAEAPVSTFSVDVDTGAYANVRRMLHEGVTPPAAAVRTEELLNYFRYDYPLPTDKSKPFSITTDLGVTPWNPHSRLIRVGLRAYDVPRSQRPAANLVFLVDVSGSMDEPDKLPLVKNALNLLADQLRPDDKVSIIAYAGNAGMVLAPTHEAKYVHQALTCLEAGGSTAGGQGIALAYATARANLIPGGINRVILATDGDFNVGVSSDEGLEALVEQNMKGGITLTTLGFGEGNYNDSMMMHLADMGNGNYAYIDSAAEARKVLDDELSATLFTVAKDVKIQVEFNPKFVSQYRLIGYEKRELKEADFSNDNVDAGDMGAGHQVTALYEIVPVGEPGWVEDRHFAANNAPEADGHGDQMMWLKLRYKLPDQDESRLIEQPIPASVLSTPRPVSGDLAFAAAVAAYGQILRQDSNMGGFKLSDARALAGTPADYRRQEFVELTKLAETARPAS